MYRMWKGRKAKIFASDGKTYLGIGKYVGKRLREGFYVSTFKLGRKLVYGYECWWIPVSIAEKVEKEVSGGKK